MKSMTKTFIHSVIGLIMNTIARRNGYVCDPRSEGDEFYCSHFMHVELFHCDCKKGLKIRIFVVFSFDRFIFARWNSSQITIYDASLVSSVSVMFMLFQIG